MEEKRQIDISSKIIFKFVLIILGIGFLYVIRDVLALLFISIIIVAVIDPMVDWMQKKKIPRTLGVTIIYLSFFIILGVASLFLTPLLGGQLSEFSSNIPQYSQSIEKTFQNFQDFLSVQHITFDIQQIFGEIGSSLSSLSKNIFSTTVGVFSGLISAIVVMSLAFYMAVREEGIKNFVVMLTPEKYKEYAAKMVFRVMAKIGKWTQGQLILMITVAVLDSIGLYFLGVPYAIILGIFAGFMEIIPFIGPIISAIPGIILGFTISPLTGLLVFALYFIVQQIESNIIVPQVMKRALGLNPIAVILALLVGAKLGGVMGMILSVPIAATAGVFLSDFFDKDPVIRERQD
jgi:predicted PurR-regulated permease PerM